MNRVIVVCGPTGIGKSKIGIELAKKLNGEIINADSTQVYREMNIGTAKITEEEKEGIVHRLIDVKEITDDYSVYDYQNDCRECIEDILKRGKTPIIVGGTGLYIKAALYDYNFSDEENNADYSSYTNAELYKQLLLVDPNTEVHINNRKRIERALIQYQNNNIPPSQNKKSEKLLYDAVFIGLTMEREKLYDIINKRTDKMIKNGLIEEAEGLYKKGIKSRALLTPIAYKELFEYFKGDMSLDESIDLIKQRVRKYAKRQYTWFRNQLPVIWYEVDFSNLDNTTEQILNNLTKTLNIN